MAQHRPGVSLDTPDRRWNLGTVKSLSNERPKQNSRNWHERRIVIQSFDDVQSARRYSRQLAARAGLSEQQRLLVGLAVREVGANIIDHATEGLIIVKVVTKRKRRGIEITAQDAGPGMLNPERALSYCYSTRGGSGIGLPAARWLMDEFQIESSPKAGTKIIMASFGPKVPRSVEPPRTWPRSRRIAKRLRD